MQAPIQLDLLQDLPEHVEKTLRQEQSEDQRSWEAVAARLLVASYEACQGAAKTLETLVKHVKPLAGWLRKMIAWRQQQLENLWRAQTEKDSSFDPQAPSAQEVLDERLVTKACFKADINVLNLQVHGLSLQCKSLSRVERPDATQCSHSPSLQVFQVLTRPNHPLHLFCSAEHE